MLSIKSFLPKTHFASFLVISISFDHIKAAVFNKKTLRIEGVGRSSLDGDLALSIKNATEALGAVVQKLPKETIVGIQSKTQFSAEHSLALTRSEPSKKIVFEEVDAAVKSSLQDKGNGMLFFSTISHAEVDGVKVPNPIGVGGSKLNIKTFNSFLAKRELDNIDLAINDLGVDVIKVMPTSFSLVKLIHPKIDQSCLIFYMSKEHTEITKVYKETVEGISTVNMGISDMLWSDVVSLHLGEEATASKRFNSVYLWGEADLDAGKDLVEKLNWDGIGYEKPANVEILSLRRLDLETELDLAALRQEINTDV